MLDKLLRHDDKLLGAAIVKQLAEDGASVAFTY